MFKKMVSMLLCVIMALSVGMVSASAGTVDDASDVAIEPLYEYASGRYESVMFNALSATCYSKLDGYSDTTKIEIKMSLQKKGLIFWSDVASWSQTFNGTDAYMSKTYTVSGGGTYRVKTTYRVYSGSAYEDITGYSAEVKV